MPLGGGITVQHAPVLLCHGIGMSLVDCRYTRRTWSLLSTWAGRPQLHPQEWKTTNMIQEWWEQITTTPGTLGRPRTLVMLVIWEIWKDINGRIFQRKKQSTITLIAKIRNEASTWARAGVKHLESSIFGRINRYIDVTGLFGSVLLYFSALSIK